MLPDFLILGAQKSGTSWLAEMLGQHPEVCMAPREIHFFDKGQAFAKGTAWYEEHFQHCIGAKRVGEKTPDYFAPDLALAEDHQPGIHHRIKAVLPDARFVLVLRDPVDRAVSAAQHVVRTGRASPLRSLDSLLVGRGRRWTDPHGVIEYGFYMRHLEAFLQLYPRDRFLVLVYEEDVARKPAEALRRTCEFLDVDSGFIFQGMDKRVNPMRGSRAGLAVAYHTPFKGVGRWLDRRLDADKRKPSPETVARLQEIYAPENERLFEFLGRRIPAWD